MIAHVKSSRVAPGFSEILAPGEPEFRSADRKSVEGIAIDETTWGAICDEARAVDLIPTLGWSRSPFQLHSIKNRLSLFVPNY